MSSATYPHKKKVGFFIFPSMPFSKRAPLIVLSFFAGIAVQINYFVPGSAIVLFGILLSLVKSVTNAPATRIGADSEWKDVTVEEFGRINDLMKGSARWANCIYNIASPKGIFFLLALLGGSILTGWLLLRFNYSRLADVWLKDSAAFLVLFFAVGRRDVYRPKDLLIKVKALQNIIQLMRENPDPGIVLSPKLEIARMRGDAQIPGNARLFIKFKPAPEDFMALQIQVSINRVGSKRYPYLYAVFVAKKGFDFRKRIRRGRAVKVLKDIRERTRYNLEPKETGEVDVLVFRQHTTKRSGYYTNARKQRKLARDALSLARAIFADNNPDKSE